MDLKGELSISALERSFQELTRRHEIFRTTFHVEDNVPVQRIAPYQPSKLEVFDLSQAVDPEMRREAPCGTRLIQSRARSPGAFLCSGWGGEIIGWS